MVEFSTFNNKTASTKLFLFFITKGLYSQISFDIVDFSHISICGRILKYNALPISRSIETI